MNGLEHTHSAPSNKTRGEAARQIPGCCTIICTPAKYFGIPAYEGPLTRRIRKIVDGNPKRGKSGIRFGKYRTGMTVQEYVNACKDLRDPNLALFDITWDTDREFIELYD